MTKAKHNRDHIERLSYMLRVFMAREADEATRLLQNGNHIAAAVIIDRLTDASRAIRNDKISPEWMGEWTRFELKEAA